MNGSVSWRRLRPAFGLRKSGKPLAPEEFQTWTKASEAVMDIFNAYLEQLCRWQAKINLVGATTLEDPWRRHFLDSAQLYPLLTEDAQVIVDIGSGAGFPALVMAIFDAHQEPTKNNDKRQFHLIESNKRKGVFLREIIRLFNISAIVHDCRAENYDGPKADVVTARACAPLSTLLSMSAQLLVKSGRGIFLKGAKYRDELTPANKDWNMLLTQQASSTSSESVILQVENLARANDA